ncbi:pickpocket protein 28 isoform X2 [Tribolium castaneum]|uniref:Pickpocket protein 28-like Protein n=1 Tax=Tribolium castaneum TaxID=7070 RepID=D6WXM7_TRICA|nr:PREDICTED: pickpocket protein 28 isoform X2 [Tribolium castaneum]EFA08874.1 Pickpocket protein 28-like Protein [Tribolium castaneum]|eukprot:XP_008196965.1 PREDICTED: pickpocket protein 28 isoform X2 [Tribolium castaneum]
MTIIGICGGSERGDLELTDKANYVKNEEGKRSYTCGQNLLNYVVEFCNNGTIHGIRYFGEYRTWIEKLWWAISICLSLYFCITLIIQTYIKWETSPVIVSFATKETAVWQIPFPAVTICPESKTRASVFNYTHYLHKKQDNEVLSEEEERKFGYLSFICDTKFDIEYKSPKYADEEMLEFLEQVQPKFLEDSFDCKFLGIPYNCSELFVPILTDDGICYVFNIVDRTQLLSDIVVHFKNYHKTQVSHDWNLEQGYAPTAGIDAYPRRALRAGIPYALEIKMAVHVDDLDYTCGTDVKGFKVQIAHPQRMPRVKQQHFIVPLERVAKAGIAPDMMTTSVEVKEYKPRKRNCHFPSERGLKYFKKYSQNNCAIECWANFTMSRCGCVPFYVPREESVPLCGAGSLHCLEEAQKYQFRGNLEKKIDALSNKKTHSDIPDCRCFPICTSMYYDVENTQATWDWRTTYKYNKHKRIDVNDKKKRMSMLQVFFKGNQFIYSERNELYGSTDLLANVGGLLGLFIGFSALSLVEIIYYLTLRIICNVAMFGRRNWSGTVN